MTTDFQNGSDESAISGERTDSIPKIYPITLKISLGALMTALVTVATMILSIPIPQTSGYFNFGDSMIFITAILLGAYVGGFAGGFGAGLADLLLGYTVYAPITLIVKGLEGLLVGFIYQMLKTRNKEGKKFFYKIVAVICGAIIMVAGYFFAEFFILGLGWAAAAELIPNLLQVGLGGVVAVPIAELLEKIPILESLNELKSETA